MAHQLMKGVQVPSGALDVLEGLRHPPDRGDGVVVDAGGTTVEGSAEIVGALRVGYPSCPAAIACAAPCHRGSTSTRAQPTRWQPFTTSDEDIADALLDVSIPTLMLSLVHMSGDPELIRGALKPAGLFLNEVQGYMTEEDKAEVRALALDVITDYRDRGCPEPEPISAELLHEMMTWLVCEDVPDEYVPMLMEEMELDGADARVVPPPATARRVPRRRDRLWPVGPARRHPAAGSRDPVHHRREERRRRRHVVGELVSRRTVDVGTTSTATASSRATSGPSSSRSSPSCSRTSTRDAQARHRQHVRWETEVLGAAWDDADRHVVGAHPRRPRHDEETLRRGR